MVVDAGVILGWFEAESPHRALRAEYEAGTLAVIGPRGLIGDALGTLANKGVPEASLARIGAELQRIGLQLQDPPVEALVTWLAKGLQPDRAAYPALAASLEVALVADDPELAGIGASITRG